MEDEQIVIAADQNVRANCKAERKDLIVKTTGENRNLKRLIRNRAPTESRTHQSARIEDRACDHARF